MGIEMILQLFVSLLGEYLLAPIKAAKWSKYFLKARDYLNLLFPEDLYPKGGAFSQPLTTIQGMTADKVAVPISAVKEASAKHGFSMPRTTDKQ